MLSCNIWFSAPSFWMGGGLESRCVGRVYGADGAVRCAGCAPDGHLKSVTILRTRCCIIQFDLLMMSTTVLETCRGI